MSEFQVDFTSDIPSNGGIFPAGLTEVSRKEDISGDVMVENQYNFGLYYVFTKSSDDDETSEINADWIMDFQEWVQEQSIIGEIPQFGDKTTAIKAENGALYEAVTDGVATYMIQLSVSFEKLYRKE